MVTSGRGCAEQASLACGQRGGGEDSASPAGWGNEIPSVSASFVIQKQCRKIQPCHPKNAKY